MMAKTVRVECRSRRDLDIEAYGRGYVAIDVTVGKFEDHKDFL
jgi:hypothetical protein